MLYSVRFHVVDRLGSDGRRTRDARSCDHHSTQLPKDKKPIKLSKATGFGVTELEADVKLHFTALLWPRFRGTLKCGELQLA